MTQEDAPAQHAQSAPRPAPQLSQPQPLTLCCIDSLRRKPVRPRWHGGWENCYDPNEQI